MSLPPMVRLAGSGGERCSLVVVAPKMSPPMFRADVDYCRWPIVPPLPNWAVSVVVSFVVATLAEPFQNFASAAAQVNVPGVSCKPRCRCYCPK